ncbi:hypothetical protein BDQ17DRAFT_1367713 [Cyathus striatus]|nr:hypothetical protein BDQ17DRAFT_1367713 [Cyathus striatus]
MSFLQAALLHCVVTMKMVRQVPHLNDPVLDGTLCQPTPSSTTPSPFSRRRRWLEHRHPVPSPPSSPASQRRRRRRDIQSPPALSATALWLSRVSPNTSTSTTIHCCLPSSIVAVSLSRSQCPTPTPTQRRRRRRRLLGQRPTHNTYNDNDDGKGSAHNNDHDASTNANAHNEDEDSARQPQPGGGGGGQEGGRGWCVSA